MTELESILSECSISDWDGYGAEPIDKTSIQYAMEFIAILPAGMLPDELDPEPTGDLTMVWRKNDYHLIVGIDSEGRIAWGGTSPNGQVYGDAVFDLEIPDQLMQLLHDMYRKQPFPIHVSGISKGKANSLYLSLNQVKGSPK